MKRLKAIFFDMDGTIVDTEKDGHRVAFNEAFALIGIDAEWDVATYHQLLQISGGKERMKSYFLGVGKTQLPVGKSIDEFVQELHLLKTELFVSLIENGKLPLRPGIKRIMQEANDEGILIGICTTSNEKAVKAIVNALLADVKIDLILAGDVVAKKKPDPEIYTAALQMTRLSAHEALVIEDSENGLLAGKAAGINVLVTVNDYTRNENLTYANAVLSSLGDANEPAQVLSGYCPLPNDKMLHINNLIELL